MAEQHHKGLVMPALGSGWETGQQNYWVFAKPGLECAMLDDLPFKGFHVGNLEL